MAARQKASKSQRKSKHDEAAEQEQASLGRRIWDQVGPLLIAVLIALGIRATVIESFYVPSESMLPTLLIGDHVFVNKFVYGAKVPFTDNHLPALRDPERGEIAVFSLGRKGPMQICPRDECPDFPVENFVKRIAAVPGDRVEYKKDVFYLNGEPVPAEQNGQKFRDESNQELVVKREALGDCYHEVLDHPRKQGLTHEPFTVPEGRYYFLGDNRDNSNDSRKWRTVPRADLKGPVIINYWSWNNQESWPAMLNPLTWIRLIWGEMRWDRIGMTHGCEEE